MYPMYYSQSKLCQIMDRPNAVDESQSRMNKTSAVLEAI